jgi:hypothetical protein
MPADIGFETMVDRTKLRWRIERDYQDLKQELGLGHYEGRGWRGLHHHISLCIAAYGFLIAERAALPPSGHGNEGRSQTVVVSHGHRPRGAAVTPGAAHSEFHIDTQAQAYRRPGRASATLPVLSRQAGNEDPAQLMTQ